MADTKTSALSAASALGGTELVAGVQGGVNVKITFAQVGTYIGFTPVNSLTAGGAISDTDKFPALIGGNDRSVTGAQIKTFVGALKNNYAGGAAPSTIADSAAGYAVGSEWWVPGTGDFYRCRDSTASAAKWVRGAVMSDHPGYVAGRWYVPFEDATVNSAVAGLTLRLSPVVVEQRITISDLFARVSTISAASTFHVGIYACDPTTGYATGTPLAQVQGLSGAVAGNISATLGANVTLEPGVYWGATVNSDATLALNGLSSATSRGASRIGSPTLNNLLNTGSAWLQGRTVSAAQFTFASGLPDLTSLTQVDAFATGTSVFLGFKVASVP